METHEERANAAGDPIRTSLLTLALGGIAGAYTLRLDVTHKGYWIGAALAFVVAIACIVRSRFLVKARALDGAAGTPDAAKRLPTGKWHIRSSWLWDSAAVWALGTGVVVLVIGLG